MSEVDMSDTEYTTPRQAAEIRAMKAELPLWAEFAQPATPGVITPETTIGTSQVQSSVNAPADVSSLFSAQWLADVELHRRINDTFNQESEA